MTKTQKADQHKEQAAMLSATDRERAAHHLTAANAFKRGQSVPLATQAALRK